MKIGHILFAFSLAFLQQDRGCRGGAVIIPPHPTPPSAYTPGPTPQVNTPTPRPTQPPPKLEVRQLTSGRAIVHIDLRQFAVNDTLEYYPLFTMLWAEGDRHSPWAEVSVIGAGPGFCDAAPCWKKDIFSRFAIRLRFSGDPGKDGTIHNEKLHCGEGTNGTKGIPIGKNLEFDLITTWGDWGIEVSTPAGAWRATRGAPRVGFGFWMEGVPDDRPYPWGSPLWEARHRRGRAYLTEWAAVGFQAPLRACPE
jgi:hypothetical protein